MPVNINFDFIAKLEGGSKTRGYVPCPDRSNSGVTVASGFDLGQRNESDLRRLGISGGLVIKLKPYLGLKKREALKFLVKNPLNLSQYEAREIDKAAKKSFRSIVIRKYNSEVKSGKKKFSEIPSEAQTVIISVAYQHGFKTPIFWEAALGQDWKEVIKELRNFGDRHRTRRNKEADLMEKINENK